MRGGLAKTKHEDSKFMKMHAEWLNEGVGVYGSFLGRRLGYGSLCLPLLTLRVLFGPR